MLKEVLKVAAGVLVAQALISLLPAQAKVYFRG